MNDRVMIPESQYAQRIVRASQMIADAGLDVLVANSNEADYANARYFTAYWPLFEMGGVAIAPSGQAALLIGPESEEYARGRSTLDNIHLMTEYRETADPAYPGVAVSKYGDVFKSIGVQAPKRIGLAGYLCTNMAMIKGLREAFPEAEIINADDSIVTRLRSIKSAEEIACLREGLRLGEMAMQAMIEVVEPGMTELQLTGVAVDMLYRHGAECEAHTVYAFGGKKTNNAISRGTHRCFEKGDIVQINVGGKIDGYSPSVGRPLCLGKMTDEQKRLIEFGKEMHYKTYEWMEAGAVSGQIAQQYEAYVKKAGFSDFYLYGPCHGLGMIEVEKPWLESISTYALEPNMTFQADTFFTAADFGLRWENGLRVTESGPAEMLNSGARMELIEIDC